jgi:hypothetical protein
VPFPTGDRFVDLEEHPVPPLQFLADPDQFV